jgi:hypothetical protein
VFPIVFLFSGSFGNTGWTKSTKQPKLQFPEAKHYVFPKTATLRFPIGHPPCQPRGQRADLRHRQAGLPLQIPLPC